MPFNARTLALPTTIPFVGPEALERRLGRPFLARLGANESVFGPSPKVVEAMSRAARDSWAYGDPEHHALRSAIADHLGIRFEEVVVGEGIDGLFGLLTQIVLEPGDAVVTSHGAYPTFNYHVTGHGGVLDFVPYRDDREDIDALIERMQAVRPKLVYFANPDNPTGSWHEADAVRRLMDAVPEGTLLVLDEAYSDLAPASALPAADELRPNVLRFRTFSKAYGMAGVRVAYVFGAAETVAHFHKVRNHFGVSRMAQGGAVAALEDQAYLSDVVARIVRARDRLGQIASSAGLRPLPSATNFVAIDCGRDGAHARRVLEGILDRQVFIRMPGVAPLDRMIRVTVGRDDELDRFAAALTASLADASD
ncbi:pyridoxal phosphate-dependent aminotransferase [Aureimonas phyllosphaerae]|uniref:histidinol-phosphate transaminase n=1 Tax=Aureimonas phyllosphaerae TaxID=1166078 RepID=A0A7W6FT17_9HYPH|nr:pyridoxal phosphate-dependent aminotransferase [Aureimonas phyllosphaerae]MBB3934533.1 histidinol-phosphate aminotransferase [Aureimonas phyllosphaerae]MBB3958251.1 histidinol-phosphate aminotransferase [Aureimonas phyllosphaerae]SFE94242.1 histidinol-phosphate aminotransferase [Aureimonas phyllosphaerae]